jgi:hypothetical protein
MPIRPKTAAVLAGLTLLSGCATTSGPLPSLPPHPESSRRGLVYGASYALLVSAPQDWVLDTKSGSAEGLQAVFYPEGRSWQDAPAVLYVKAAPRTAKDDLEAFIARDLGRLQARSPDVTMQPGPALETADRKKVEVRHFSADRWGDSQAIAYIREKTVVVMVVLAARTPRSYESALPAFAEVVQSYKLMDEDVHE